jgi:hypothetical protein
MSGYQRTSQGVTAQVAPLKAAGAGQVFREVAGGSLFAAGVGAWINRWLQPKYYSSGFALIRVHSPNNPSVYFAWVITGVGWATDTFVELAKVVGGPSKPGYDEEGPVRHSFGWYDRLGRLRLIAGGTMS